MDQSHIGETTMDHDLPTLVLHWNYRGFTEFPFQKIQGDEDEITDIYLKQNLISQIPKDIAKLVHLESLYLSGNDITVLPKEISQLQCLKCLDISGNRLRTIPEEIGDLRRLKFLILDENELTELPLRIAELRRLRYLSVCDNKLQWLPQRPVYNYYHCEFRFWRNNDLKTIPYSLWYHMFRDQQIRSLDIGCLKFPKYQQCSPNNRCRLKLATESRIWEYNVGCPPQYETIFDGNIFSPPSLFEICRRNLYQAFCDASKKLADKINDRIDAKNENTYYGNGNQKNLEDFFQDINIDNGNNNCDLNGNHIDVNNSVCRLNKNATASINKEYYVPKDLIEEYFSYLPRFIKGDLCNGPVSKCENTICKKPIFDYAFFEFCIKKIILIDNTEEIILSVALCSKSCVNSWRRNNTSSLSWTVLGN